MLFDNLDDNDLYANDKDFHIKHKNFYITKTKQKISTAIKAELLDANICQNLIFNEIKDKIKKPSYYQIITFINILMSSAISRYYAVAEGERQAGTPGSETRIKE